MNEWVNQCDVFLWSKNVISPCHLISWAIFKKTRALRDRKLRRGQNPWFKNGFPDLSRSGCLQDRSHNVLDWSTSVNAIFSCPARRTTERITERPITLLRIRGRVKKRFILSQQHLIDTMSDWWKRGVMGRQMTGPLIACIANAACWQRHRYLVSWQELSARQETLRVLQNRCEQSCVQWWFIAI